MIEYIVMIVITSCFYLFVIGPFIMDVVFGMKSNSYREHVLASLALACVVLCIFLFTLVFVLVFDFLSGNEQPITDLINRIKG